jgi:Uma2 family endonuclease
MPTSTMKEGPYLTDLLEDLGNISPQRVLLKPAPGTATAKDVLDYHRRTGRLCELVDGTLVEKVIGLSESIIAGTIFRDIGNFAEAHDLGIASPGDGPMRLLSTLVRYPDVAFFSWKKLPTRQHPTEPIPDLVPDMAIEVLSEGNTPGEIKRKLKEYFLAGTVLAWVVDPNKRIVSVYTAPDKYNRFTEGDTLDGGAVLPGFKLSVTRILADRPLASKKSRRKPRPS